MVPLGFMKNDVFLSYLVSPTASLLQRFPSKFSDKIPVRIENHNPGVGHHNLSLQSKLLFLLSVRAGEGDHLRTYTDAHHVLQLQLLAHFPPDFPGENVRKPLGLLSGRGRLPTDVITCLFCWDIYILYQIRADLHQQILSSLAPALTASWHPRISIFAWRGCRTDQRGRCRARCPPRQTRPEGWE